MLAGRRPSPSECHAFVRRSYNWRNIAERTERVYDRIMAADPAPLGRKLRRLWEKGAVAGPIMAMLMLFCHYWVIVLDYFA